MIEPPSIERVRRAADCFGASVVRTPLLRLYDGASSARIFVKLENLQPIGSFKIRGASAAMRLRDPDQLRAGVYTASAGNMAQGVAWIARQMGIPCTVIVPDHAPETKLAAIERLEASIVQVPFPEWWQILVNHHHKGQKGLFIHPVSDPLVIAGNATIGLEIAEQLPDLSRVIVPYGGGGLSCGIAAALAAVKPEVPVFASEVETAAPLSAALAAGAPVDIEYKASFVDGIGGRSVLGEMWPLASRLLRGSLVVSLEETAEALRLLLERNRILVEGAAATAVAAARGLENPGENIVCILSGGNLDFRHLATILSGRVPG